MATTPRASRPQRTHKGYVRIWDKAQKRYVMEHVMVWESLHGPVPPGHDIHHLNGVKTDNRPENLALVDRVTHKRLHSGCLLVEGVWWKPCRMCGELKRVDEGFYTRGDGSVLPWCKVCSVARSVANRRKARQKTKARRAAWEARHGGDRPENEGER